MPQVKISPLIEKKIPLSSVQILSLNSSPIDLIDDPGPGKMILIVNTLAVLTFNSVAYATNTNAQIFYNGAAAFHTSLTGASFLSSTTNKYSNFGSVVGNALPNAKVYLTVQTGNPTAGDSNASIHVTYKIITL